MQNNNEIHGYSLFNDVEDTEVQAYNRARIVFNMLDDNADKDKNVSQKGTALVFQYFQQIPETERAAMHAELVKILEKRNEGAK